MRQDSALYSKIPNDIRHELATLRENTQNWRHRGDIRKDPLKKIRHGAKRHRSTWQYSGQYMAKFGEIRQELPRCSAIWEDSARFRKRAKSAQQLEITRATPPNGLLFYEIWHDMEQLGGFGEIFRYLDRLTKTLRIESHGAPTTFHARNHVECKVNY